MESRLLFSTIRILPFDPKLGVRALDVNLRMLQPLDRAIDRLIRAVVGKRPLFPQGFLIHRWQSAANRAVEAALCDPVADQDIEHAGFVVVRNDPVFLGGRQIVRSESAKETLIGMPWPRNVGGLLAVDLIPAFLDVRPHAERGAG